jgi:hypothetical protein
VTRDLLIKPTARSPDIRVVQALLGLVFLLLLFVTVWMWIDAIQVPRNEHAPVKASDLIASNGGIAKSDPPGSNIPEQLEQIAELNQRGVLTDSEFKAKKSELLARM